MGTTTEIYDYLKLLFARIGKTFSPISNKEVKKDLEIVIAKAKKAETKARETLSAIHEGTADNPELESALKEANSAIKHFKKFFKN